MHGKHPIFATSLHKHSAKKTCFRMLFLTVLGLALCNIITPVYGEDDTVTVSGIVVDDEKNVLPMAHVKFMDGSNTSTTVVTNGDGEFTLQNVPNNAEIEFSYIGFETKTVSVADIRKNPTIQLVASPVDLDQVLIEGGTPCKDSGGKGLDANGKCICQSGKFLTEYKNLDGDSLCKCVDEGKYQFVEATKECKPIEKSNQGGDKKTTPTPKSTTPTPTTPKMTKEEAQKQLTEAEEELAAARDAEQSFANRALGATATAATGLGAMQLAEGIAEQNADAAAEEDMRAYIATMKCTYGRGQQVELSNEDVTLPGGNDLLNLYTEYKQTAERLKATKAALGLRAGIESEVLYDKAQTGLYQYANTGRVGGGYTSLYNALTDETGDDAAAWASQKDISAQKRKAGAIAAAGGVALGIGGNLLVNEYEWGDDDDNDDPSLSQTQRQQKKTCRRGGGTWDITNGCQCSAGAGLTLTADKTTCECSETGYKYNKGTKKCAAKNTYNIDVTKDGYDYAGFNEDNTCYQKGEKIDLDKKGICTKTLSQVGTWWALFRTSWAYSSIFYGESKCENNSGSIDCLCKPNKFDLDGELRDDIDATNWAIAKKYQDMPACESSCAHDCASSFATSQDLREQTLGPILEN